MSEQRILTRAQELQVYGLLALAHKHKKIVDDCQEALKDIVEPDDEYGDHSGDTIWGDGSVEELLKKTNCVVL